MDLTPVDWILYQSEGKLPHRLRKRSGQSPHSMVKELLNQCQPKRTNSPDEMMIVTSNLYARECFLTGCGKSRELVRDADRLMLTSGAARSRTAPRKRFGAWDRVDKPVQI